MNQATEIANRSFYGRLKLLIITFSNLQALGDLHWVAVIVECSGERTGLQETNMLCTPRAFVVWPGATALPTGGAPALHGGIKPARPGAITQLRKAGGPLTFTASLPPLPGKMSPLSISNPGA